jgi:hypothetical protein
MLCFLADVVGRVCAFWKRATPPNFVFQTQRSEGVA